METTGLLYCSAVCEVYLANKNIFREFEDVISECLF
jgi:hypothetical protein